MVDFWTKKNTKTKTKTLPKYVMNKFLEQKLIKKGKNIFMHFLFQFK